ncbi:C1 family peptidase [Paraburkholderia sp. NPDC080076]|uniref:C1 family peptidase n=1 Tax=Paraburkholderia sp. NPDC080076 TaxID=3390605 RepID=UPI003D094A84
MKMPTPISVLQPFAPNLVSDLSRLAFTSVEQVLGAAQISGPLLQTFLGGINLATLPLPPLDVIPPAIKAIIDAAVYAFGVPVAPLTASYAPGAGLPPPPLHPSTKSLVPDMSPIRYQGNRPTCVAFSSLAALEHNVRKHPGPFGFLIDLEDCSEQWLYYRCKKADENNKPGTLVSNAYRSLQKDGTVPELDWPYESPAAPNDPGTPLPVLPELALSGIGSQTRIREGRALNGKSIADFRAAIDNERAVTFWVPVFKSWSQNAWSNFLGQITMPIPDEKSVEAHAMCVVGYMDQPESPEIGGGRFIVRNSWGANWGLLNIWGDRVALPNGYGTIPYAYIANFGCEAFVIARGPFE